MRRGGVAAVTAALLSLSVCATAYADGRDPINGYRVDATPANLEKLALAGFDVTEGRRGSKVEIYGTARQAAKLETDGVDVTLVKDAKVAARLGASARESRRPAAAMPRTPSGDGSTVCPATARSSTRSSTTGF